MNFLLRGSQSVTSEPPTTITEMTKGRHTSSMYATLEGLIAEESSPHPESEDGDETVDAFGTAAVNVDDGLGSKTTKAVKDHDDVSEEEGRIIIPCKELAEDWSGADSIHSFQSLDRDFVFPGEQFHILVCLSAPRQEAEVITPFRLAALMSRNDTPKPKATRPTNKEGNDFNSVHTDGVAKGALEESESHVVDQNGDLENERKNKASLLDVSASESLLRMEDHKQQTEAMLHRFKKSHFFVRVCHSDEPLWSKKSSLESSEDSETLDDNDDMSDSGQKKTSNVDSFPSAIIEKGSFDPNASGGAARNVVKCCSLSNGDIVVLLQVNVGINTMKNSVLEVLQFEKDEIVITQKAHQYTKSEMDPYQNLLNWLFPLDRPLPPPCRHLPPSLSANYASGGASQRSNISNTSSSPLFSFGNFRSYSMPSLPQNVTPPMPSSPVSKPNFALEDWDNFLSQKFVKAKEASSEELVSFRGVSLEPHRFSVHCGLEGLYVPGRRWKRKIKIIQPVEIRSFASNCNTDDLLCVQIKNVVPEYVSDIVIFVDSINVIFEETSKGRSPISLPIACINAGDDYRLPDVVLRRGEEHSFILKPRPSIWKDTKGYSEKKLNASYGQASIASSGTQNLPSKGVSSDKDQYAVLLSCRSNCTESKLFFKQSTNWKPRVARDLMLSVASDMLERSPGLNGGLQQLPVQVLTLHASNLTSEDLTVTVLAPASFTSPTSVVSLNSAPSTPNAHTESSKGKRSTEEDGTNSEILPSSENLEWQDSQSGLMQLDQRNAPCEFLPDPSASCTHLWLQSRVPLGCIPSQSTAAVRLELLPLTDGIINLDTLQVAVKEKDAVYVPENSLKIYSTSSIASGIC